MSFFSLNAGKDRVFGLDLLRFFAIAYVVLGHSKILAPEHYHASISKVLLDGVSIFFVLSGFLIGRILLKQLQQEGPSFKGLMKFWSRRWMRTLPAYFFVLLLLIFYTGILKPARLPDDWYKYFLFIQNFNVVQAPFFSESWSLSVEEWFYLLVPVAFFSGIYLLPKFRKTVLLILIFSGIAAVLLFRFYLFKTVDVSTFEEVDMNIMRQVLPRLDSIMFGVLGAFITFYFPQIWNKGNKWWIFIAMIVVLYIIRHYNESRTSLYFCVYVPMLKSLAVLFMLPYLSNLRLKKENFLSKSITFISVTSYSIYLINRTIVIDIIIKYGMNDNLRKKHVFHDKWVYEYILFWVLSVILAFVLYKLIEQPFLNMRDGLKVKKAKH